MKRSFVPVLAAGLLLVSVSGCRKSTYEKTVSHVDVGGKVLIYQENPAIRESFHKGNDAVKSLLLKHTTGFRQFTVSSASDALNILFDAVNPDVQIASAFSVAGDGKDAPYRVRSFSYLGEKPVPSAFDLIPRENRPFELVADLPEETVLALGGFNCYAPFWKHLRTVAEQNKNQQIRLFLDIAEAKIQQSFGVPMEEFLLGLEGEQQLFFTWDGKSLQLKIVVSDSKELLRKSFFAYASQNEIRRLSEGLYALDIEKVREFGWEPRLRFSNGTMIFASSPVLLQTPARPMVKSPIWKPYFRGLPARGTGYAAVRLPESVIHGIAKAAPDGAPLLEMIPETVVTAVMFRESDGVSCAGNSSVLLSPGNPAILPFASMAASLLAKQAMCLAPVTPQKQETAPAPKPAALATPPAPGEKAVSGEKDAPAAPAAEPAAKTAPKIAPKPAAAPALPDEAGATLSCSANMKRIMTSLLLYAGSHEDAFPRSSGAEGLYELVERGYADPSLFRCRIDKNPISPERHHESSVSYYYFGGYTLDDGRKTPNTPLLIEKPGIHTGNFTHVLFADGHWEKLELKEPYTSLAQALDSCLAQHPISADAAAKLKEKLPQE